MDAFLVARRMTEWCCAATIKPTDWLNNEGTDQYFDQQLTPWFDSQISKKKASKWMLM